MPRKVTGQGQRQLPPGGKRHVSLRQGGPSGQRAKRGQGGGPCDRVPDADPLEFFFSLLKISDPYSVFLLLH